MADCVMAIYNNGKALSVVTWDCVDRNEVVAEWTADPDFRELVRVPVEVAREFLFKDWPGRDEAIRAVGLTL